MNRFHIQLFFAVLLFGLSACASNQITSNKQPENSNEQEQEETEEQVFDNSYSWPEYDPTISYDFRDDYGEVPMPQNVLDDDPNVVGTQSDRWWTFRWGPNKNSLVTEDAVTPMLERFNKDFKYFREEMGWPPDLRARNGYKSAIYLFGSGLSTDDAPNTAKGGWQSAVWHEGQSWPIVLASYYPVYSFDPAAPYDDKEFQQGAMVHEGIHSIVASLPGAKDAAWFHEGGNTWLQLAADAERSGDYSSMGFLSGATLIAPFMPIESYSGWLQDGSFGGPAAEGVNMFNGDQQICTWRNYLGGNQYGSLFPVFLGLALGEGSVAWVWQNATGTILEGIAEGIGEEQMRRLIVEYRSKQALADFGKWSEAVIGLLDNAMGMQIEEEWEPYDENVQPWRATPYSFTRENVDGLLIPEQRTTPGWSGANQVPLTVAGDSVTVNFQPRGENMRMQLAYIAEDGSKVYSEIIEEGDVTLNLHKEPANDVIIAVVTNTNYIYRGEMTRKTHYDYRLQPKSGVTGTADIHTAWYHGPDLGANKSSASVKSKKLNGRDISEYCKYNLSPPRHLTTGSFAGSQDTGHQTPK